jgi:adenine phosphoribosyltransferase
MAPARSFSRHPATEEKRLSDLLAAQLIRDIPDFPQPGILFRDITPVLGSGPAFQEVVHRFAEWAKSRSPDLIVGIEARGFIFGAPVAVALGLGFVPVRKVGKLPFQTMRQEYSLEYGANAVEVHQDAIERGQRVLIVDDVLATGGTAQASARLIEQIGGDIVGFSFLVELEALHGRRLLDGYAIQALLNYD